MPTDSQALLTILGMAIVTYLTRAGGFYLVKKIKISGRFESFLKALPGTILISIIAPTVLSTGPAEGGASLLTAITAWRTKNLPIAMIVGIVSVALLRYFI